MIEKEVRRFTNAFIEKLALVFSKLHISPNTMSFISFLVGFAGAYSIALGELTLAFVLIAVSGILDAVDGSIARITNKTSKWGALLDSTLDKIVEIAIFVGIFLFNQSLAIVVMLCIIFMMLSSYTNKHIATFKLKKSDYRPFFYIYTFADRFERLVLVSLALIFPAFMREILYIYVGLVVLSFIHRMIVGYRLLK